jgi:hypothetical protein
MMANRDLASVIDQTLFGIDTLTMLGDVEDFIAFSEINIDWQKHRELRRAEKECDDAEFDDAQLKASYRDQRLEGVEFRFEASLKQRVRYSALITLITTIEWTLLALKNRSAFSFPKKPNKKNEVVHVLSVLNQKTASALDREIQLLEVLVQVRNCIVHAAGLLASYQHESEVRRGLALLTGIRVSKLSCLGDGIEIEAGFLDGIIKDVGRWLPQLEQAVSEQGLLRR